MKCHGLLERSRVGVSSAVGLALLSCGTTSPPPAPWKTPAPEPRPFVDAAGNSASHLDDVVWVSVGNQRLRALIVPGTEALRTTERLRHSAPATGQYPVIVGEFGRATEYLESLHLDRTPQQILEASRLVDLDPALWTHVRDGASDGNPVLRELLDGAARYSATERQRVLAATTIPAVSVPPGDFIGHRNLSTGKPFLKVLVVLIPTQEGWKAPAYLGFGGTKGSPLPAQHTQLLRHWHEAFGAKVVTVGANALELGVERPPLDSHTALELARVQYEYCPGLVVTLGATLGAMAGAVMQLRVWYFRWE